MNFSAGFLVGVGGDEVPVHAWTRCYLRCQQPAHAPQAGFPIPVARFPFLLEDFFPGDFLPRDLFPEDFLPGDLFPALGPASDAASVPARWNRVVLVSSQACLSSGFSEPGLATHAEACKDTPGSRMPSSCVPGPPAAASAAPAVVVMGMLVACLASVPDSGANCPANGPNI
jgi:hypothetical protein